jgi:hypothetical protein
MLKFVIDRLEDVDPPLRAHYVAQDGKFHLAMQGDHPKVVEFRTSNVELLKEREALKAKLTDLERANPDARISALETALAAEKAARTQAQEQADKSRVRDVLRVKALAAGVLPGAVDILLDKAASTFTMEGDAVKARPDKFSPTRPGELLSTDEWIASATKEFSFLFGPSSGSGAETRPGGSGSSTTVRELRNPTPQQLGEFAAEIKAGRVKVV